MDLITPIKSLRGKTVIFNNKMKFLKLNTFFRCIIVLIFFSPKIILVFNPYKEQTINHDILNSKVKGF